MTQATVKSRIRPSSSAGDEAKIIQLLARAFQLPATSPYFDRSLLRWKFWEPRLDCTEPRSLVLEREGRILAHAGLWPITIGAGETLERGVQMIDWASDPDSPGAGISLLQHLLKSYDFIYSIGGSDKTQIILPKLGFRSIATATTLARPIRPWQQTLHRKSRDLKLVARLVRSIWWSTWPFTTPPAGWSCAGPAEFKPASGCERGEEFFRYLGRCPAARFLIFELRKEGASRGFFVLSVAGDQARLAGAWLAIGDTEHWRAALHFAQEMARRHTTASEFVARSVSDESAVAATQAGLRARSRTPVFLFRKKGDWNLLPIQFQLVDDDGAFQPSEAGLFLT